jgi:hypothetical protein
MSLQFVGLEEDGQRVRIGRRDQAQRTLRLQLKSFLGSRN